MITKLFYFFGIACAAWVVYDVWFNNKRLSDTGKIVWTAFALFFNIIAAAVYYWQYKRQ